jgi:regulator of replication initiation timing
MGDVDDIHNEYKADLDRVWQAVYAGLDEHIKGTPSAAIKWGHERAALKAESYALATENWSLKSENAKLRKVLEYISNRRNGHRRTVNTYNALEAFSRVNAELLVIFAECDAALEEGK